MKQTLLHGLFPAVRAEVLRLLFTNAGQELYTRELPRLSFLALRTVQDELAKLESANLIVRRSNGYQRFYRANAKHPLYRHLTEIVRKSVAHPKTPPRSRAEPSSCAQERTAHLNVAARDPLFRFGAIKVECLKHSRSQRAL